MDRIRKVFRRVSIPAAFIICGLSCLLASLGLTKLTMWFARKNIDEIESAYEVRVNLQPLEEGTVWSSNFLEEQSVQTPPKIVYYSLESGQQETPPQAQIQVEAETLKEQAEYEFYTAYEEGGEPGTAFVVPREVTLVNAGTFRETDRKKYDFFQNLDGIASIFWYTVCLCAAAMVFYLWKIRKPFHILNRAVEKIAENDLDYQVDYEGQDEFGRLCHAFEVMRRELVRNNQKMWDSVEERKRLNAAFAHDLRTPITVLRGNVDLLQGALSEEASPDRELTDSVHAISQQVTRLNDFVNTMGTLQRLEDYEPCPKQTAPSMLEKMVSETGTMLFPGGRTEIRSELGTEDLFLDREAFAQICENLLSNAARYAREKITVSLSRKEKKLILCVEDDGPGFTEKDLANGALAYYRGEKTCSGGVVHFGLGLYICSLLAEKLGGDISLSNGPGGRVIVTAAAVPPQDS